MTMCDPQTRMADLNAIIRDFERLFRSVVGGKVSLRATLDPKLGPIHGDPSRIGSLLVNLLMHARDATPAGGEITIATLNADLDEAAAGALKLSPGAYVLMELGVNGRMEAPSKVRAFVHEAQGAVTVRSNGAHGSSVTIVLPRTGDASAHS